MTPRPMQTSDTPKEAPKQFEALALDRSRLGPLDSFWRPPSPLSPSLRWRAVAAMGALPLRPAALSLKASARSRPARPSKQ